YREKAEAVIAAFSGELQQSFFPLSSLLLGADVLRNAQQIVIAGAPGADDTAALEAVLRHSSLPTRLLIRTADGAALPPAHPAAGKTPIDGKATVYVCRGMTCSPPITDPGDLRAELAVP
ncbi:MAG: thioredoxin domain-containing protein, partial [Gammaproteobacteria bacterium]